MSKYFERRKVVRASWVVSKLSSDQLEKYERRNIITKKEQYCIFLKKLRGLLTLSFIL